LNRGCTGWGLKKAERIPDISEVRFHSESNPERETKTKPITGKGFFFRLLHRSVIKYFASVALNKTFCLPVEIEDWFGKGRDRAHSADPGAAEGTADALFEFCASLVIEKRYDNIIVSLADKIEPVFECNPIMLRCKGAVRSVRHTVFYLPVGDEVCGSALPAPGLVVKVPITFFLFTFMRGILC
jgi:hypothetical protein